MEENAVLNEGTAVKESTADTLPAEDGTVHADEGIAPAEDTADATEGATEEIDYRQVVEDDLRELRSEFPELSSISDLADLPDVMRYAALRDLGLTATEAYLATAGKVRRKDNRSHLVTAVSRSAGAPRGTMSREELSIARELFSDMSDSQIYDLYRRVKK